MGFVVQLFTLLGNSSFRQLIKYILSPIQLLLTRAITAMANAGKRQATESNRKKQGLMANSFQALWQSESSSWPLTASCKGFRTCSKRFKKQGSRES